MPWGGQAFPYLMHHPNTFHQTENYGSQSERSGEATPARADACCCCCSHPPPPTPSDCPAGHGAQQAAAAGPDDDGDRTGVWNGPAPRGYVERPMHVSEQQAAAAASA